MFHVKHLRDGVRVIRSKETIFALATSPGRAALAVMRLSGDRAALILQAMTGILPDPRVATLVNLRDPVCGRVIDQALVYWFPGPRSFTGEDCVEFSVHGSRAVVEKMHRVLAAFPFTRIAEPGEFARRALENRKLTLLEIEALSDLLSAETETQRIFSIEGLSGRFQNTVEQWREQILSATVNVEATLDFSDEQDVQLYNCDFVISVCEHVLRSIDELLKSRAHRSLSRNGVTVLISGPPNAGKSSLLNELSQREVAIVSDIPGTTRDLIEVQLDLGGHLVNLIDSAGVRESADPIESIGISKAFDLAQRAHLILWLFDQPDGVAVPSEFSHLPVWPILTKCDLRETTSTYFASNVSGDLLSISVETGYNVEELLDRLNRFVDAALPEQADFYSMNERHFCALERAQAPLRQVVCGIPFPEVVAAKLREAVYELEVLVGRIDPEDVLDAVFSRFCIGK